MIELIKAEEKDLKHIIKIDNNQNIYKDIKNKDLNFMILKKEELIIGYIIYLTLKNENLTETELHNIAVDKKYQRKGYAQIMLKQMIKSSSDKSKNSSFFLEVRESNFKAINLYKKKGFEQIGTRKNYYNNPKENALIFHLKLVRKI